MCGICHIYAMEDGAYIEEDVSRKIVRPSDTHGRSLEEEKRHCLPVPSSLHLAFDAARRAPLAAAASDRFSEYLKIVLNRSPPTDCRYSATSSSSLDKSRIARSLARPCRAATGRAARAFDAEPPRTACAASVPVAASCLRARRAHFAALACCSSQLPTSTRACPSPPASSPGAAGARLGC